MTPLVSNFFRIMVRAKWFEWEWAGNEWNSCLLYSSECFSWMLSEVTWKRLICLGVYEFVGPLSTEGRRGCGLNQCWQGDSNASKRRMHFFKWWGVCDDSRWSHGHYDSWCLPSVQIRRSCQLACAGTPFCGLHSNIHFSHSLPPIVYLSKAAVRTSRCVSNSAVQQHFLTLILIVTYFYMHLDINF